MTNKKAIKELEKLKETYVKSDEWLTLREQAVAILDSRGDKQTVDQFKRLTSFDYSTTFEVRFEKINNAIGVAITRLRNSNDQSRFFLYSLAGLVAILFSIVIGNIGHITLSWRVFVPSLVVIGLLTLNYYFEKVPDRIFQMLLLLSGIIIQYHFGDIVAVIKLVFQIFFS